MFSTKGSGRVVLSLGGTALVAGLAFARCRSSSITGPQAPTSAQQSTPGPQSGVGKTYGSPDNFGPAVTFGPLKVPIMVLPIPNYSPCTHQAIAWDPMQTYSILSGYTQTSLDPLNPSMRSFNHVLTASYGTTDPAEAQLLDEKWRKYKGSDERDTQLRVFSNLASRQLEEWDIKILSYGRNDERHDQDDFFYHMVTKISTDPTKTSIYAFAYCKDTDYGWWKTDRHYTDDDDWDHK